MSRTLSRTAAALAAATVAVALLPAPSAQAASSVVLDPRAFPRGADVAVPHLEGKYVVDGALRIKVRAPRVFFIGKAGTGYVVGTSTKSGGKGRIVRVEADGSTGRLGKGDPYNARLSSDGLTVLTARGRYDDKTDVTVRSATTGTVVATRTFAGYPTPLDAEGSTVLVAGFGLRGTQAWDYATDTVGKVTRRTGGLADYALDLLVSYTGDPYRGGCAVLSRLSSPGTKLWTSCDETPVAFSTDGSRMATVDILSDGIGPGRVWARTVSGGLLAAYDAPQRGYLGDLSFESPTALLVEANGPRKGATLRCVAATCERATDIVTVAPFRTQARVGALPAS